MKLIALHAIQANRPVPAKDKDGKDITKYRPEFVHPAKKHKDRDGNVIYLGGEFDTADYGISDEEAAELCRRGSARRQTREVLVDEDEDRPSLAVTNELPALPNATGKAANTAPRGPASGSTGGPAPNTEVVGRNAR